MTGLFVRLGCGAIIVLNGRDPFGNWHNACIELATVTLFTYVIFHETEPLYIPKRRKSHVRSNSSGSGNSYEYSIRMDTLPGSSESGQHGGRT
jgi:hypothetical protein